MRGQPLRRWLWPALGLALVVVLALLFQPVFSSDAPAWLAGPRGMAEQPVATQLERSPSAGQPALETSEEAEDLPSLDQVAQIPSDNCIACHTNQALLEQLAEEPEVVESELASGEG